MRRLKRIIKNPYLLFSYFAHRGYFNWIGDEKYLRLMYRAKMNIKLNLQKPRSYNEKLQWLKLHDRKKEYIDLVDKFEVRKHISKKIGEEYLIPILGVWNSVDDINFDLLPNQFVLKCTHDSGGVIVCRDRTKLDINSVRETIRTKMKRNYYYQGREWPYKDIIPRIVCEEYMVDESGVELKDYKFFCFNGQPKAMFVATDRGIDTRFDYFDLNFKHLPLRQHYKNSTKNISKPKGFDDMLKLSRILSEGIPHVRIDFYDINGRVYFGEYTFYHFDGFEKFEPEKYDEIFGDWLDLSK